MPAASTHSIRPAEPRDAGAIHAMICELAEFEKLAHQVVSTPDHLVNALFESPPAAEALIAERAGANGGAPAPVGFALFFHNYSTFAGRRGLYLEDLYVRPEVRGLGVGKALLRAVAGIAHERACGRFEWSVLDWNQGAIDFYRGLGAAVLPDWRICRMDADDLARFVGPGS